MALPDLVARLEHEAQSRVEAIRREADAGVRAIEDATERAVADITTARLERARADRHADYERELAAARRNARARELEAHHALLARVAARARSLLPEAAASSDYAAVLPRHLDEALSFLQGLHPRVRCQSAFVPILARAIAHSDGATLDVDETTGPGIIAEALDGSVIVDNTLAARLTRVEAELAVELARRLREPVTPAAVAARQYAGG